MLDNNNFLIIGGDGNEQFEQSIRSGISEGIGGSSRLINVDLAQFVPFSKNGYKLSLPVVDMLLHTLKDSSRGCVIIPGSIMPVADEKIIDGIFNSIINSDISVTSVGMKHGRVPSIFADDYQGIKDMLGHLYADHKCYSIGYVSGPDCYDDAAQRNRAYIEFCRERSMTVVMADGDFSIEGGKKAAEKFISTNELGSLNAIVCADDTTALGVVEKLKEKGYQVPGDVIVTGFDNSEYATSLGLASVNPLLKEQGKEAYYVAINKGESKKVHTEVIRNTTCGCHSEKISITDIKIKQFDNNLLIEEPKNKSNLFSRFIKKSDAESTIIKYEFDDLQLKSIVLDSLSDKGLSSNLVEAIVEYIFNEHYKLEDLFLQFVLVLEDLEDLNRWATTLKENLDTSLQLFIDNNKSHYIVRLINIYQNYNRIISKITKKRSSKDKILDGHLDDMLTDIRSEIISSNTIEDLVSAIKSGAEELGLKDLSMLLFEGYDCYSFSDSVQTKLVRHLSIKNGKTKIITDGALEAASLFNDELSYINDNKITIVPLYYENPFGYLIFGDVKPAIIQSVHESISLALENIRKRELELSNKILVTSGRDKIVGLIEPLINTAYKLSNFVMTEKELLINNLNVSSNESIETIHKANKSVEDVNTHLKLIVSLIKSIDDITEKTEVLSINASIEAARAGEYGRGFKVISSGIKKLSEAQRAEAERVDSHIKEVENAMLSSITAGSENQVAIDKVKNEINNAINFFGKIEGELDQIINNGNSIVKEIQMQNS